MSICRLVICQRSFTQTDQGRDGVSMYVCLSVCLDVLGRYTAMLLAHGEAVVWSAFRADFFSLCQTLYCLIVTDSDSLLLALRQSEQPHSLCAGSIKAHLSESCIRRGGGGLCNSTCCALVPSCVCWVCLCASLAGHVGKGTICDSSCKRKGGNATEC